MQVSEVMHKGVVSANINDSIRKVSELMRDKDIGALPVFEADSPVGFVTDRDLVVSGIAEGLSIDEPVSRAMSDSLICIQADQDVEQAAQLMRERQVSRLMVIDKNKKPLGLLSLRDLSQTGDEEIESETLTGIKEN